MNVKVHYLSIRKCWAASITLLITLRQKGVRYYIEINDRIIAVSLYLRAII